MAYFGPEATFTHEALLTQPDLAGAELRPFCAITDVLETPGHSVEFREAAGSDLGRQAMLVAAKGLAMTAVDLLTNPDYLTKARSVFDEDLRGTRR